MTEQTNISTRIKTLKDKAMLARLKRKRLTLSKRDKALETTVRAQAGDDSLTISKHLFRDRTSPVRRLIQEYDEVYRLHKDLTLPWVDTGPRLLKSDQYFTYMERMREAMDKVAAKVPSIVNRWGDLVAADIRSRGGRASPDDYPAAYEVEDCFAFDLKVMPLPDASDFRVDVDDDTVAALEEAMVEAEQVARRDVVHRMLEPVARASEKLAVPIGEQGAVFRDSLIHNLEHGVRQARELNISDDPELERIIAEAEQVVGNITQAKPEGLRKVQGKRDEARKQLDDLMDKLGSL